MRQKNVTITGLKHPGAPLAEFGLDEGDVVKVTNFVQHAEGRLVLRKYWAECYPDESHRPARHTIVGPLNIGLIQLEIYAVAKDA